MEPVWDSQGAIDIDWLEVDKTLLSLTYPLFAGQEGGLSSGATGDAQSAVGSPRSYKRNHFCGHPIDTIPSTTSVLTKSASGSTWP